MYTKGIRKILACNDFGRSINYACEVAEKAKYDALCFNGQIFIKTANTGWVSTPFIISDFEVSLTN